MIRNINKNIIKAIFALLILVQGNSFAQTAEELAKKLSNPIASFISVPFQNNTDFGFGKNTSGVYFAMQEAF